jgi:hypothetical protein
VSFPEGTPAAGETDAQQRVRAQWQDAGDTSDIASIVVSLRAREISIVGTSSVVQFGRLTYAQMPPSCLNVSCSTST